MRLTDIMSNAGLSLYPTIALVIFVVIFAVVLKHAFSRSNTHDFNRAASLPLEDDAIADTTIRFDGSKP